MVRGPVRRPNRASRGLRRLIGSALVALGCTACGGGGGGSGPSHHAVLAVPSEYPTIQAAVDHAQPGDLVLISPGTYHEAVVSHVPDLVIRGLDRSSVVLDGGNDLPNGITVAAAGDAVENLTVRRYAINGVLFTLLDGYGNGQVLKGYQASYVTSYDNGLYGLYAFDATDGLISNDDASGQPDSGIYIGQCQPCNVVVEDSRAESNRVGFEAANASGGLTIVNSRFAENRAGVVIESDTSEQLIPQIGAAVAGNVVSDNDNRDTPTTDAEDTDVFGYGIAIGGGSDDQVLRNRVSGNPSVGIIVTDQAGYLPKNNSISGNVLNDNQVDLVYVKTAGGGLASGGNCFTGNRFSTSEPADIQTSMACGHATTVQGSFTGVAAPASVDYASVPAPAPEPGMPGAATTTPDPAIHQPPAIDLATVAVPSA